MCHVITDFLRCHREHRWGWRGPNQKNSMWKFDLVLFGGRVFFLPWRMASCGDGAFFCPVLGMGSLGCAGIAVLDLPLEGSPSLGSMVLGLWSWKAQSECPPFAETMPLTFTGENYSHSHLPLALFSLSFCDVISLFSLYPKSGSC